MRLKKETKKKKEGEKERQENRELYTGNGSLMKNES